MYDSSFAPPPLTAPDTRKHSRIGILSFVIGILAALVICLTILLLFGYGFSMALQSPNSPVDQGSPAFLALVFLIFASPVLSLVGVGVGIGAVMEKSEKKLFGILGLVLNLLIVSAFCLLMVIGISGQSGGLGL
jgi:hypothetical protein